MTMKCLQYSVFFGKRESNGGGMHCRAGWNFTFSKLTGSQMPIFWITIERHGNVAAPLVDKLWRTKVFYQEKKCPSCSKLLSGSSCQCQAWVMAFLVRTHDWCTFSSMATIAEHFFEILLHWRIQYRQPMAWCGLQTLFVTTPLFAGSDHKAGISR